MKILLKDNVFDAALKRMERIFAEFENVCVTFSGGKDSTVVFNIALIVAKRLNRLPLKVVFIDQEAEWATNIEYVKRTMYRKDVEPRWFQMPIRISNCTSTKERWLMCWEKGAKHLREKDPISIKENEFGTTSFKDLFEKILEKEYSGASACMVGGVRAEESPNRKNGLCNKACYKDITWGRKSKSTKSLFTFYQIYDWSYTDVWAAISKNKWDYCNIYDKMHQYGIPAFKMRVSSLHHETAVSSLYYLQEIEPDTWDALTERLRGINTAGILKNSAVSCPKHLPEMFESWVDYRDYLLKNIITEKKDRDVFRLTFEKMDMKYSGIRNAEYMYKVQINSLLTNDYHLTKISNFESKPSIREWRVFKKTGLVKGFSEGGGRKNKFIYA